MTDEIPKRFRMTLRAKGTDIAAEVDSRFYPYEGTATPSTGPHAMMQDDVDWILDSLVEYFKELTDEGRLEFLDNFKCCRHCGGLQNPCNCMKDD